MRALSHCRHRATFDLTVYCIYIEYCSSITRSTRSPVRPGAQISSDLKAMTNPAAEDTTVVVRRLIDAPPERVFDAWLMREQWDAWIGPEGMKCDVPLLEPQVGGRYRITTVSYTHLTLPTNREV